MWKLSTTATSPNGSKMSDDFRVRIAAALYDHWWHGTTTLKEPPLWEKLSESAREGWLRLADAVIRELETGMSFSERMTLWALLRPDCITTGEIAINKARCDCVPVFPKADE